MKRSITIILIMIFLGPSVGMAQNLSTTNVQNPLSEQYPLNVIQEGIAIK